jgi:VanZ family protein
LLRLRYPWLWSALGWLLVAGVVVGSLVPSRMLHALTISDKLMHAGSYFLLMVWFAGLYSRRRHFAVALVLLGLGIGLDLLQGMTKTRTFDPADIAANATGILAGLLLSMWLLEGWCQRLERRLLGA